MIFAELKWAGRGQQIDMQVASLLAMMAGHRGAGKATR